MSTFSSSAAFVRAPFVLVPLLAALFAAPAQATSFTVDNTTNTGKQTLGSGSGQTGTVTATGKLSVNGSNVAVTVSGNNAVISNLGVIEQTGTGRAIRDNTGVTNLVVTNGSASNHAASITTADADVIQMNVSPASVTLNNYGKLVSNNASIGGAQAVDFAAIASGNNVVNNYTGALLQAFNADSVRPGVNGTVNNAGTIQSIINSLSADAKGSDGVDIQSNTGIVINNAATGVIDAGRHGITGGPKTDIDFVTTIRNDAGGTIRGNNGSGVNLDGFSGKQSAVITNGGTIVGNGVTGDGDGVDVDGLVTLINTGVIRSLNAVPDTGEAVAYSEGISVGGGKITNSGVIEGLVAAGNAAGKGIGITLTGNDITAGPNAGNRDGLYGNATVLNQSGGLIRGQNSSAIVAKGLSSNGQYAVTITNEAGATIQGGGSTDAAIALGADNDVISNAGRIDGSSSGKAIDMGAGNNTLHITGGAAVVLGDINGGVGGVNTLTVAPGAGNTFAYGSGLSNFATVEVVNGTVALTGQSSYTGTTQVDAGATLILDGANRLAAASKLDLEGGTLKLVDMHGATGQEFAVLSVGADSAIDLGDSSLTIDALGQVVAGKTLTITDLLSSSVALRFAGDLTHDSVFLALMGGTTIDGAAASWRFDGRYTDVTAVPEPANVALLLAGLGLLGGVARRRARA